MEAKKFQFNYGNQNYLCTCKEPYEIQVEQMVLGKDFEDIITLNVCEKCHKEIQEALKVSEPHDEYFFERQEHNQVKEVLCF